MGAGIAFGEGRVSGIAQIAATVAFALLLMSCIPSSYSDAGDPGPVISEIGQSTAEKLSSFGGYFIENRGQVIDGIRYYSRGNPSAGFRDDGVMFVYADAEKMTARTADREYDRMPYPHLDVDGQIKGRLLAYMVHFDGTNSVVPFGNDKLHHESSFFIGNDSTRWRTGVPAFREVVYRNLYDGIDLIFHQTSGGMKYEFVVNPGADPGVIVMTLQGIESLKVDDSGVTIQTLLGKIHDYIPYSFQEDGGSVACVFMVRGLLSYGFECPGWDRSQRLTIDPLIYSTFLGGSEYDYTRSVAVDADGNAYVGGWTSSPDFPVTPGVFSADFNSHESYVVKINAAGDSLVYSTFVGGSNWTLGFAIAVDSYGNAYVGGYTADNDFPTTPGAFDTEYNGNTDAFALKLNKTGSALIYSTYIGGRNSEFGYSVALDSSGDLFMTGETRSSDFPLSLNAFDRSFNVNTGRCTPEPCAEAYVVKLDPLGSNLLYSTFVGGISWDTGRSIALDSLGMAYITGDTASEDFPTTTGAFDRRHGYANGFVTKLNADGSNLLYSTYLGGSHIEFFASIAVDSEGNAYVTGTTTSDDFPTTKGAFDTTRNGPKYTKDAFVTKLNSTGGSLLYSTYLGGGQGVEQGHWIVVDSHRNAVVVGFTNSPDFPVTSDAFDATLNGNADCFVTKLDAAGTALAYSTFLGGKEDEYPFSVALNPSDGAYVVGETWSDDFPVYPEAVDTRLDGPNDAFVSKFIFGKTNHAPTISSFQSTVADEGTTVTLAAEASDPDNDSLTYYFDFESDGVFEVSGSANMTSYSIGDDYVGNATVRVSDGELFTEATTTVVVRNLPPTVRAEFAANVTGGLTLRVAGEKWHDVAMTLYEDEVAVAEASVTRFPGSPDDQAATIDDVTIDLLEDDLSAVVEYTPEDDPINGGLWGATPAWLIFTAEDGSESRLHHTFNVRHEDTWTWIVPDLRALLAGVNLTFTATATDPGSDDLTFIWDWGDGSPATTVTYYNDGIGPDPYPSPDGTFPFTATDVQTHAFATSWTHAVILTVIDDDGGSDTLTLNPLVSPVKRLPVCHNVSDIDFSIQKEPLTSTDRYSQVRDDPPFDPPLSDSSR